MELAAELEAFLRDDPVKARPPSRAYLVAKFVRRHRTASALTGLVFVALLVGTLVSLWQASEARNRSHRDPASPDPNGGIVLGSSTDLAANMLELSDAELDRVMADTLVIGTTTSTGSINVSQPIGPAGANTLHLIAGVGVAQSGTITVPNLAVEADGTIDLSASNDSGVVAFRW